jgi:TonB family protein
MTLHLDAAGIRIMPSRCTDAGEGLRLRFPGSASVAPAGEELRTRTTNYLIGNDRSRWVTSVRNYGQVRYSNLYQGVDLVLHGDPTRLEFDVELAPSAQYQSVRLQLEGARHLSLSDDGGLVADTACGRMELKSPNIYQQSNRAKQHVEGRYKLLGDNVVGFELGEFDPSRRLVIDPVLSYGTFFPEDGTRIVGIAADAQGAVYVTGTHDHANFPLTVAPTACPTCGPAKSQIFVAKISPDGKDLVYLTYFGGSAMNSAPVGIGVDAQGHAVVAGQTNESDFPTTARLGTGQVNMGFITSFTADGSGLNYSVVVATGEPGGIYKSTAIAVHSSGDAYVTGSYWGNIFPFTPGTVTSELYDQSYNILALKITKDGQVGYATVFGSPPPAYSGGGTDIAVDVDGDAYIVGTAEVGLPTTPGAFQGSGVYSNGKLSGGPFVAKLNPTASAFSFLTYYGPAGVNSVAVGPGNSVYIAGPIVSGSNLPPLPPGAYFQQPILGGGYGGSYVTKFSADGTSLLGAAVYATVTSQPQVSDMAVDESGNVYIIGQVGIGQIGSPDLPLLNPLQVYNGNGYPNQFIAGFDSALTKLTLASYIETSGWSRSPIAYASGHLFVAINAANATSPTTPGALRESPLPSTLTGYVGFNEGAFLAKIDSVAPGASICPATTGITIGGWLFQQSTPQPLTVTNCGNAPFTANASITNSKFSQTNNCVAIAPGATCTFNIGILPIMAGNRIGTLVIRDAATNNRQDVNLVGVASGPYAVFEGPLPVYQPPGYSFLWQVGGPSQGNFGPQPLGTTSAPMVVQLWNDGNSGMYVDSISASGDFAQTNDCNQHIFQGRIFLEAVGGINCFCNFSVTFSPAATGLRTGTTTVVDSAGGSPHIINWQGMGKLVLVAPSALDFGGVFSGLHSGSQAVTIANTSGASASILGITTSRDYVQTNNCPPVLATASQCTIQVAAFVNRQSVNELVPGTLNIVSGDGEYVVALLSTVRWFSLSRPQRARRYGTDSLSPSMPYSLELAVNAPTNVALPVSLSCSGAPAGYACSVEPSQAQVGNDVIPITVRLAKAAGGQQAGPGVGASTLTVWVTAGDQWASFVVPVMLPEPEASSTQPPAALPQVTRNQPAPLNRSVAVARGNGAIPDNIIRLDSREAESLVLKRVQPEYPTQARQAGIQGSVVVMVAVSAEGDVSSAGTVSGDPMLAPSAIEAAKRWKFKPNLLDGHASPFVTNLTMDFQLDPPPPQ